MATNKVDIEYEYDRWLEQQANFLKRRDFTNLDIDNLIEEEALGWLTDKRQF